MSVFDDIIKGIPAQHITTTPYQRAVTLPDTIIYKDAPQQPTLEKGILYGYCAVWKDSDGLDFVDSYDDVTVAQSWQEDIARHRAEMQRTGSKYLMPHLFNHDKNSPIGGVQHLAEDSKGVVYESKIALNTSKGREVYELAREGVLGTSYGYEPLVTEPGRHPKTGKPVNRLVKIAVRELSSVVFPANPYAVAHAKSRFYVPSRYGSIAELSAQMTKSFDALESQLNNMHSDFPTLPGDDYAGTGELTITDLLSAIQHEMRG